MIAGRQMVGLDMKKKKQYSLHSGSGLDLVTSTTVAVTMLERIMSGEDGQVTTVWFGSAQ